MADKKKTKSKSKKGKVKTKNPSNRKGGEGQRVKNRPRDNLFIGDAGGLPDSMYRFKDPGGNVNLQPLQNEIAQIRNYMQQQDSRMQLDIPSDLVRGPQLDQAIKKLSTDLQSKLIPPKPDIVMKDPQQEKRDALAQRIKVKDEVKKELKQDYEKQLKDQADMFQNQFKQSQQSFQDQIKKQDQQILDQQQKLIKAQQRPKPALTDQSINILDFKPKKPQMVDQISQATEVQIQLQTAQNQLMNIDTDRMRKTRQQKRTQQQLKDQDEGQKRILLQQRKLEIEEKKVQQTQQQNQLLQEYTKVLQQKAQNPINVNYNVANNTSNFSFQQNTQLTRNQYLQKNNYENQNVLQLEANRFTDLGAFPSSNPTFGQIAGNQQLAIEQPAQSGGQVVPYEDRSVVEVP